MMLIVLKFNDEDLSDELLIIISPESTLWFVNDTIRSNSSPLFPVFVNWLAFLRALSGTTVLMC